MTDTHTTLGAWRSLAADGPTDLDRRIIMGVRSDVAHVVGEGHFDDFSGQWLWSIDGCSAPAPTHWMPLPEMPA